MEQDIFQKMKELQMENVLLNRKLITSPEDSSPKLYIGEYPAVDSNQFDIWIDTQDELRLVIRRYNHWHRWVELEQRKLIVYVTHEDIGRNWLVQRGIKKVPHVIITPSTKTNMLRGLRDCPVVALVRYSLYPDCPLNYDIEDELLSSGCFTVDARSMLEKYTVLRREVEEYDNRHNL